MHTLFINSLLSHEMLRALCFTLVHSLWQGLLAAAVAGLIIIGTKNTSALLRYNLLCVVLLLFFITSGITFYRQINQHTTQVINNTPVLVIDANTLPSNSATNALPANKETSLIDILTAGLNKYAALVVLVWAIFFVAKCMKLFTGLIYIHRIRNYKTFAPGKYWDNQLIALCATIGIQKPVRLLQSGAVTVPVAIGIFKPLILLPLGLLSQLPPDQVETILLHELAHIRRKDYLVNILQSCAETIFFFNPALLWISSLIREEREACCDDIVMAKATHKNSYLNALVSFQEFSHPSNAMALGASKMYLLKRVQRLLTRENKKLNTMEKVILLTGLIAVIAFGFIPPKQTTHQKKQLAAVSQAPKSYISPVSTFREAPVKEQSRKARKRNIEPVVTIVDTVPAPSQQKNNNQSQNKSNNVNINDLRFTSIHINGNDNDNKALQIITAIDQNGQVYIFKTEDKRITSLAINGNEIPATELANYTGLYEKILTDLASARAAKYKRMELARQKNQERMQLMRAQQDSLRMKKLHNMQLSRAKRHEERMRFILKNDSAHSQKKRNLQLAMLQNQQRWQQMQLHNDSARQHKKFNMERRNIEQRENRYRFKLQHDSIMQKKIRRQKIELLEQREHDMKEKRQPAGDEHNMGRVRGVINDLVQEKVIANAADVKSFGFRHNQLAVNNQRVADLIHEKLKAKYDIRPGNGLFYGASKIHGAGIVFDEKDIK
jgi:bla regulator protein BlaR1